MSRRPTKPEKTISVHEGLSVMTHHAQFEGIDRWQVVSDIMHNGEPFHNHRHRTLKHMKFVLQARNPEFAQAFEELHDEMHGQHGPKKREMIGRWLEENESRFAAGLDVTAGEFKGLWASEVSRSVRKIQR